MTPLTTDFMSRFVFDDQAVRGQWIVLEEGIRHLLHGHDYPQPVATQLIYTALAANLMAANLKIEGRVSLQAQSGGDLSLLLVQVTHQRTFRGIARHKEQLEQSDDLKQLMPGAQMAITIEPEQGNRYQGIVPMHQHTMAANLEDYFQQSEQLATRLWLFTDGKKAAGLMLQALPGESEQTISASFDHLSKLAQTLSAEEALNLAHDEVLHRLFHQDPVRLFDQEAVTFACSCSRDKSMNSLLLVPKNELEDIIAEDGHIDVTCEFCQSNHRFDSIDLEQIFANSGHNMESPNIQ